MPTTNEKLNDIVEVMSDAYRYMRFRNHLEMIESQALQGDKLALEFMERFESIYRLAKVCLK